MKKTWITVIFSVSPLFINPWREKNTDHLHQNKSVEWISDLPIQTLHSTASGNKFYCCAHTDTSERVHVRTCTRWQRRMAQPPPAAPLRLDVRCCRQLHSSQRFMNTLPFMFIQTLIYLPSPKIKEDTRSRARKEEMKRKSTNKLEW